MECSILVKIHVFDTHSKNAELRGSSWQSCHLWMMSEGTICRSGLTVCSLP